VRDVQPEADLGDGRDVVADARGEAARAGITVYGSVCIGHNLRLSYDFQIYNSSSGIIVGCSVCDFFKRTRLFAALQLTLVGLATLGRENSFKGFVFSARAARSI
jgi:hypothetical protein